MYTKLLTNCPKLSHFLEDIRKALIILNDNGFDSTTPMPISQILEHWFDSIGSFDDPETTLTFQSWIGPQMDRLDRSIPGFISKKSAIFLPNIRYLMVRALYFSATSRVATNNKTVSHFRETQTIQNVPANMFPLQLRMNEELLPGISNLALTGHNEQLMRIFNRINATNPDATLTDKLCIDPELLSYLSTHGKRAIVKFPHTMTHLTKFRGLNIKIAPNLKEFNNRIKLFNNSAVILVLFFVIMLQQN